MNTDPAGTIRTLASKFNLDPKDINSDVYNPDRPFIDEEHVSELVRGQIGAGNFAAAAAAIELECRRAYECEASE